MFTTIVADPPWQYRSGGSHLRNAFEARPKSNQVESNTAGSHSRYGSMSIAELKSLPVADVAASDAHLYLWTTNSFLVEAHDLMAAWGFQQKTVLTWVKMRGDGSGASARMGYYFRGATEHVLFGVRGRLRLVTGKAVVPNVLFTPRVLKHSLKPQQFFDLVERVSPGPYLEMFARQPRMGWTTWGDEVAPGDVPELDACVIPSGEPVVPEGDEP
jgi:N6-adenosine-specific RNA methylase IME4